MNGRALLGGTILAAAITSIETGTPASGETTRATGAVTTYSEIKRPGETCETGAADRCKPGIPCFARVVIDGQAARTLYEAMKLHAPKHNDAAGSDYLGTTNDAMTCWEDSGSYSCYIGYDAVTNVLSEAKTCEYE